MTCPGCKVDVTPTPVAFTRWGGWIGPRLLSHVECPKCRARWNGKTGRPNDQAIRIYVFVTAVLVILAVIGVVVSTGS